MNTKHTPGPWQFAGECEPLGGSDKQRGSAFQVWEDMKCGGRIIAEIVSTEDCSIGVTEGIANARLIASAPELLQALKAMIPANEAARRAMLKIGMTDRMIDNARAAAAKAQGE